MFKVSYIYDLVDNISPQLKKIQVNLEATRSKTVAIVQSMGNSFDNLGKKIENVGLKVRNAGLNFAPFSLALGMLAKKSFTKASEFEMLQIQLNTLTGSAEIGARAFKEVVDYANKTMFGVEDVTRSLNMLMSTGGMGFDEAMKSVKILGDIASVSGGQMSGMALAFSQTSATTRLLGQDFNQFVNNSVPLMKLLKDATGKSSAEIMKMKEAGELTFDVVAKAMEKATKAGGLYENGAIRMGQTLTGVFMQLQDAISFGLANIGQDMAKSINLKELVDELVKIITILRNKFNELSPATKKVITYAILFGAILGPIIIVIGQLAIGLAGILFLFGGFAKILVFILSPLKLIGVTLLILANSFAFLVSPIGLVIMVIGSLSYLVIRFGEDIKKLGDNFIIVFDFVLDKLRKVKDLFNELRSNASIIFDFIGLDKLSKMISPELNQQTQINKPQQLTAGGQLDVNIKGLPQGSNAGFTPRPNNFLPVGINSVFAGS